MSDSMAVTISCMCGISANRGFTLALISSHPVIFSANFCAFLMVVSPFLGLTSTACFPTASSFHQDIPVRWLALLLLPAALRRTGILAHFVHALRGWSSIPFHDDFLLSPPKPFRPDQSRRSSREGEILCA